MVRADCADKLDAEPEGMTDQPVMKDSDAMNKSAEVSTEVTTAKPTRVRRERLKLVSQMIPGYWVRILAELVSANGLPRDPNGDEMVVDSHATNQSSKEQREHLKAARAAQKLAIKSMSPEEKAAFDAIRKEAREAKKLAARKSADEKIRSELAAWEREAFERGRRTAFEELQNGNVRLTVPAQVDA